MKEERRQFFERIDGNQCRDYILSHCSKDYEKVKSSLERLMDNRFMFDSPWDMEPCSKIHQIQPMVWDQVFEDDPEWAYMLNRQEYLLQFMIGYVVEGDKSYIQKCKFFLFDWIEQVREFSPQSLMTRTLDTGIRSFTWLKLLLLLLKFNLLEEQELEKILVSLEKQIDFMKSYYRAKYTLSNWGILQTIPMLAIYHFFSDKMDLEEAYHFASEELKQQIETQILGDGSQFEQSILYHVEVYKALLDLCLLLPDLQDSY
ncbi:oligohyaluronate lyase [Streptococcus pneumoniae]|nr:oligohyaluronate lyase [Streptococcus pneumoniae]